MTAVRETTLVKRRMRASMSLLRFKMSSRSRSMSRICLSIRLSSASSLAIWGSFVVTVTGRFSGVVAGEIAAGVGWTLGVDRRSSTISVSDCSGATALAVPLEIDPIASFWLMTRRFMVTGKCGVVVGGW